jgi:hypothetical protein
MPRVGLAWSVNRQTAVRVGYGRFYTPQMLVNENATMGQLDLGAFSPTTPILPAVQGVPQVTLSNDPENSHRHPVTLAGCPPASDNVAGTKTTASAISDRPASASTRGKARSGRRIC